MNEGAKDLEQKRLKKKVAKETPKKEDTTKKRKRPQSDVDLIMTNEHKKCLNIVTFKGTIDSEIMKRKSVITRLNKVSSLDRDYLVIYRANGNPFKGIQLSIGACGVYILELEDGTVIHMLVERRYPLSKDLMQRMLDFGLEVEIESTVALDLIRFIKQQIGEE
ncbi:hypothetical protein Tco_0821753 [Tanacetum coccineum]|uniref:Uncharacterized protein n=1 Tax=Tanacetum coccineum TaxID=301880 RepID=A0ABQ5AHJ1_9ASTR